MAAKRPTVTCPRCNRTISTDWYCYARHGVTPNSSDYCPMSGQRLPISGVGDDDYRDRASLLCHLAAQVQDEDPHKVWDYLTVLPAVELQRLLQLALAAIPVDRTITEIFGWVYDLPATKEAS